MLDTFGRTIHSMRISVTDRCNMRCHYCISGDSLKLRPRHEILTLEEIEEVIRAAVELGFDAFRFTGGEPLFRRGIPDMIARVGRIKGIRKLSLSTNGTLLKGNLDYLYRSGVRHLNISIDSLRPERFAHITGGADIGPTLEGIDAAIRHGGFNIKLNTVMVRGFNDDEVVDLAAWTLEHPISVRFIEFMEFGEWDRPGIDGDGVMSVQEMLARLRDRFELEEQVEGPGGEGPARYVQNKGAKGFVGMISPVHEPFCETCNRLRLTADGELKSCLLSHERSKLRDWMRSSSYSFEGLVERVRDAVLAKPERHNFSRDFDMSTVGG